ncbi:MAG: hypothetical protein ABIZ80_25070 [Bryobacteraceae bacterium]
MGKSRAAYLASLPERVVRSAAALAGGLLRQIGETALPARLRRTKLYETLVAATLRFLIEQVGEVEGTYPGEEKLAGDFLLRRTAGNGIDLIGILTFSASPVWVLAALADLSGVGRKIIQEIAGALKQEGLLEPDANFTTMDQLLDGLEKSSGRIADAMSTPPIDVPGLRAEWQAIREQVSAIRTPNLPRPEALGELWEDLAREAKAQNRSVFALSSMLALSAVRRLPRRLWWLSRATGLAGRRTGQVFAGALLDHYRDTLREIRERGFAEHWRLEFRPYLAAAASQFSPGRESLTQKLLRRR